MKEQIVKREVRERAEESETDGIELGRPINTPSSPRPSSIQHSPPLWAPSKQQTWRVESDAAAAAFGKLHRVRYSRVREGHYSVYSFRTWQLETTVVVPLDSTAMPRNIDRDNKKKQPSTIRQIKLVNQRWMMLQPGVQKLLPTGRNLNLTCPLR